MKEDSLSLESELPAMRMKVRAILSDSRLAGHFGYASMEETASIDDKRLLLLADILEAWVSSWLRKM